MTQSSDVETVERVVPASPDAVFSLIADPSRHHEFDGSGTVREARAGSAPLALGSRFGMSMHIGVPYSMVNTVIEYEENRLLAWQTRLPGALGRVVGGRVWRYELEPVDGGTRVRETWDMSGESALTKPAVRRLRDVTRRNMAATLARIEEVLSA